MLISFYIKIPNLRSICEARGQGRLASRFPVSGVSHVGKLGNGTFSLLIYLRMVIFWYVSLEMGLSSWVKRFTYEKW
jgi:hypothetical protein